MNFYCASAEELFNGDVGVEEVQGRFLVHHLNVQRVSRLSKFQDLTDYLLSFPVLADVFCLVETWFLCEETGERPGARQSINLYNIDGYQAEYCSRETRSAGIAVYIRNGINYRVLARDSGEVSYLHLEILGKSSGERGIFLTVIYMPKFLDNGKLMETLDVLCEQGGGKEHFIVGDFNIDLFSQSSVTLSYLNLLESYDFQVTNDLITRPASETLIDHAIANFEGVLNFTILNEVSDHNSIVCFLPRGILSASDPNENYIYKQTDFVQLESLLARSFYDRTLYADLDADQMTQYMVTEIQKCISLCTSVRVSSTQEHEPRRPWTGDREIARMSAAKKKLLARIRRTGGDARLALKVSELGRGITQRKQTLAKDYYARKFHASVSSKVKWQELNRLLGRKNAARVIKRLKTRDGVTMDCPSAIAAELNTYFSEIGENMAREVSIPQGLPQHKSGYSSKSMALFQVCQEQVLLILNRLQTNKSAGIDGIPNKVLKKCSMPISAVLTCCVNKSFQSGVYPSILKRARVVPVFKGGDRETMGNYRPISVLPSLNKIFETILNDHIVSFLKYTNFLSEFQYGFRKGSGTDIAAIELLEYVYSKLDRRETNVVSGLFLDLSKAFDSVNHESLLEVCFDAGIRGLPNQLLQSYLSNRTQATGIGDSLSGFQSVKYGVPQGSVLGPTLFLVFINDIKSLPLYGKLSLYADDSALFYASSTDSENCRRMTEDLNVLSRYFGHKILTLNGRKTCYMHFCSFSKALNHDIPVRVGNVTVERVETFVYLGLHLDTHLTWRAHCTELCRRVRPIAGILFKLRRTLPPEVLMQIYYAFAHSHLSYMVSVWGHAPATILEPLQRLQNRCLKYCHGLERLTPTVDLYAVHVKNVLPIRGLHVAAVCRFVKQVRSEEIHHTVMFPNKPETRNLRPGEVLLQPFARTNFGKKRVTVFGPKCFNSLPAELRSERGTDRFVRRVKNLLHSRDKIETMVGN